MFFKVTNFALGYCCLISKTVSLAAVKFLQASTTVAPRPAKFSARALPNPEVAPKRREECYVRRTYTQSFYKNDSFFTCDNDDLSIKSFVVSTFSPLSFSPFPD